MDELRWFRSRNLWPAALDVLVSKCVGREEPPLLHEHWPSKCLFALMHFISIDWLMCLRHLLKMVNNLRIKTNVDGHHKVNKFTIAYKIILTLNVCMQIKDLSKIFKSLQLSFPYYILHKNQLLLNHLNTIIKI